MPNFLNDLNENIHFTSFSSNFNYDKVKCFINDYLTYLEFQICYFRSQFDLLYMVTELFFAIAQRRCTAWYDWHFPLILLKILVLEVYYLSFNNSKLK